MRWLRLSFKALIQILLCYLIGFEKVSIQTMTQIKTLANTNTTAWPDVFVKVYLNNYLAGQENEDCIGILYSEVAVIKVQDSNKDTETST